MVSLPSESTRDSTNIDTLERAIAWSAFLLKASTDINVSQSTTESNPIKISLRQAITRNGIDASLIVNAIIPFSQVPFSLSGGNWLSNLLVLNTNTVSYTGQQLPPTPSGAILPTPPTTVNTLERFFIWVTQLWQLQLFLRESPIYNLVKLDFTEQNNVGQLKADVAVPMNYETYLRTQDFVASTIQMVNVPSSVVTDTSLSNASLIGNTFYLSN